MRYIPYIASFVLGVVIAVFLCLHYLKPEIETVTETVVRVDTVVVTNTFTPPTPDPVIIRDTEEPIYLTFEDIPKEEIVQKRRYNYNMSDSLIDANVQVDVIGYMDSLVFDYEAKYPERTVTTTITNTVQSRPFLLWGGGQINTEGQIEPRVGLHLSGSTLYYGYSPYDNIHSVQVTIPLNKLF